MATLPKMKDQILTENKESQISAAEAFRNKYLQQNDDETVKNGANKINLYTTEQVLFEPSKSSMEPKIIVESKSKLLTKLSKSTAPMRAKLSKTNLDHLWINSSSTLALPTRKSTAESIHHMPVSRYEKKKGLKKNERSQSFSGASSTETTTTPFQPLQQIYPAFLSKVAFAFKENMVVGSKLKDSIQYHDVFDGRDAVNKLASIIKTTDRNLAILVGRALNQQKFFHDVNYENRLRDSVHELYQFKEHLPPKRPKRKLSADSDLIAAAIPEEKALVTVLDFILDDTEENELPNGVFTPLTDCYSPTCTAEAICYSVLCPRRFSQQSQNSLLEENEDRLWINTVSKSISNKLSSTEKKRQENIFELIYTEKDFVNDLTYVEDSWIEPLLTHPCLPPEKSDQFVKDVFWNLQAIRNANALFLQDLLQLQQSQKVIHQIGQVILNHVSTMLDPFVSYGAHQVISKYIFETEKSTNAAFAKYVEVIERLPISRKLELNGYLTKPTTRLGRYNLLLREILKHTPENHPDCINIPKAMKMIDQFLSRVNEESGITEQKFSLEVLEKKLSFYKKTHFQEVEDLDLLSDERKVIMKGPLRRSNTSSESSEFQIYVLDHCLLIIKAKFFENMEQFKLYRKPIPLSLLAISLPDQAKRTSILPLNRSSTGSFYSSGSVDFLPQLTHSVSQSNKHGGYPISFVHLGRQGTGIITLYASTFASRRKWVDTIEQYKFSIMEKLKVFRIVEMSDQFFNTYNKVNCAAPYGSSLMIGCDHGVYLKKGKQAKTNDEEEEEIVRVLSLDKVSQLDILEGPKLMLILADKMLYTFSLESIFDKDERILSGFVSPPSPIGSISSSIRSGERNNKDGEHTQHTAIRKLSNNVSFFKVGKVFDRCTNIERTLVCYVKYNSMTSIIRALEPYKDSQEKKKRKSHHHHFFLKNNTDMLKGFKDLYIPGEATSIQYFKNVICVGSAKGFQMVDIGSASVQSVLDPSDDSHNFIRQRETLKPTSMFRHPDGCILLCYNEIAFYIDKKGRRVRPDWTMHWEGHPTLFAFKYPYVVAFDPSFIEVRHMNTGDLIQVVPGNNIRCLRPDHTDTIYCVMEDRRSGNELVFNLKYMTPVIE